MFEEKVAASLARPLELIDDIASKNRFSSCWLAFDP
jgi:hypothetical protein